MPRLVQSSRDSSPLRDQVIERLREMRDHHPLWPDWTAHYDYEIARWESGRPMEVQGWQLPGAFRRGLRPSDRLIVESDGTIRPYGSGTE